MEDNTVRIHKWLLPLSWCYGLVVRLRNHFFEMGILKSRTFDTPVISVGNITVGGTGKTPHVEYLVRLLGNQMKVAVLSRGYKRKSRGFVLATKESTVIDIGDEPCQIKRKFPHAYVAVDANRCEGIERLTTDKLTKDTEAIILDDAYQHRYVKAGVNILLIDYNRLIIHDKLLPAGRLREPKSGKNRADIVIVTKCPDGLLPVDFLVLTKALDLYPYQKLYFTTFRYNRLRPIYMGSEKPLSDITPETNVVLLTGIASPAQLIQQLSKYTQHITPLTFSDHHRFKAKDIQRINDVFESLPEPKLIVTTEKDNARLFGMPGLTDIVRQNIFMLPVEIAFLLDGEENFNNKIIGYVRKNARNSTLAQAKFKKEVSKPDEESAKPATIVFK